MKTFSALKYLLLILFAFSFIPSAQSKFEGKVVMEIRGDDESMEMNYLVKGDKIRIEVPEQKDAAMIFDSGAKKMLIIMPEQKMYMEMPLDKMTEMKDKMTKEDEKENKGDFKMTGETKEINGYTCEKWVYTEDGEETVAWMTKDLGSFFMMENPMMGGDDAPDWQKKISGEGYFPMMVVHKDASGMEDGGMEVKSVEKQSLDASLFTPPSNFQKFDMPMMNMQK